MFNTFKNEIGKQVNMSPDQIQKEIEKYISPEMLEFFQNAKEKVINAPDEINLPEMYERLKREIQPIAEPLIDKGKEFLREMGITVKVDLNSSSPELAEVFVAEINKNPRLRSDLAQSIFGNKKEFVA
jgi:Ni,Fe-hydrogenase III component G